MMKESYLNIDVTVVILLFLAVYSKGAPDFGAITVCVNINQSLTVDCYYNPCDKTPKTTEKSKTSKTPFNCEFHERGEGTEILLASSKKPVKNNVKFYATPDICRLVIKDHANIYRNQTKIYRCALSRKASKEKQTIIVKYTGKEPRPCKSGSLLHVSKFLWLIPFFFFLETCL